MWATLTKEFKFEAAHQLLNHRGKCSRPHGHSYRVVVEVAGPVNPANGRSDEGMVVDFDRLKDVWLGIESDLDHRDLNETLGPHIGPTTAENIAGWLLERFREDIAAVNGVTVYETRSSSATVRRLW